MVDDAPEEQFICRSTVRLLSTCQQIHLPVSVLSILCLLDRCGWVQSVHTRARRFYGKGHILLIVLLEFQCFKLLIKHYPHILMDSHSLANNCTQQHRLLSFYDGLVFLLLRGSTERARQSSRLQNNWTGLCGTRWNRHGPLTASLQTRKQTAVLSLSLLLTLLITALGVMIASNPPPSRCHITPPCCPHDRLSRKWKRRLGLERQRDKGEWRR